MSRFRAAKIGKRVSLMIYALIYAYTLNNHAQLYGLASCHIGLAFVDLSPLAGSANCFVQALS